MNPLYRANNSGTADLMRDSGVTDYLESTIGAEAQSYAESIAPVATGEYAGAFRTERAESYAETRNLRGVVQLCNDAAHAAVVEARHHVLSRTRDYIEQTYG